jgi:hypothetical protein
MFRCCGTNFRQVVLVLGVQVQATTRAGAFGPGATGSVHNRSLRCSSCCMVLFSLTLLQSSCSSCGCCWHSTSSSNIIIIHVDCCYCFSIFQLSWLIVDCCFIFFLTAVVVVLSFSPLLASSLLSHFIFSGYTKKYQQVTMATKIQREAKIIAIAITVTMIASICCSVLV